MKSPFIIIIGLFLVSFYIVSQLSNNDLSDEPIQIDTDNPPKIIMFSSQSCRYCAIARTFFKKHKLAYTENDIDRSDQHREMFYRLGGQGTPLIMVNRSIVHGFEERLIRNALQAHPNN